jgi:hypothetical protein
MHITYELVNNLGKSRKNYEEVRTHIVKMLSPKIKAVQTSVNIVDYLDDIVSELIIKLINSAYDSSKSSYSTYCYNFVNAQFERALEKNLICFSGKSFIRKNKLFYDIILNRASDLILSSEELQEQCAGRSLNYEKGLETRFNNAILDMYPLVSEKEEVDMLKDAVLNRQMVHNIVKDSWSVQHDVKVPGQSKENVKVTNFIKNNTQVEVYI